MNLSKAPKRSAEPKFLQRIGTIETCCRFFLLLLPKDSPGRSFRNDFLFSEAQIS